MMVSDAAIVKRVNSLFSRIRPNAEIFMCRTSFSSAYRGHGWNGVLCVSAMLDQQ